MLALAAITETPLIPRASSACVVVSPFCQRANFSDSLLVRLSGKDSEMSNEGEVARDAERKRAEEHSRRITKWLLEGRLASERTLLPKDKGTAEREAA